MTTEERLGTLEERTTQHDAAIADIRAELRQGFADVRADLRSEIRAVNLRVDSLNARFDRLFYTLLGLLIAQAGVILTVVLRT